MVPEAPLRDTGEGVVPAGAGWFVVNARDARWRDDDPLGRVCFFEAESEFAQLDLREVLRSSPDVLLGVSADAAALLRDLRLVRIFDLAMSGGRRRRALRAGCARCSASARCAS